MSFRPTLERLLRAAGEVALGHFRTVQGEDKADGSEVTRADREVEALLVAGLAEAFPRDAVESEEGTRVAGGEATWYVDPIDGTSSFLEGLAHWGPTVCRVEDGRLQVGAFWQPRLEEFWYAEAGKGAWRNTTRLRPGDDVRSPRNQSICAPSRFHRAGAVPWPGKIRALGSSAAHLALVAAGGAAGAVIPTWAMWDVGCGALLVAEAGRVVVDAGGRPVDVARCPPGLPLLAGAPNALSHLIRDAWAERVLGYGTGGETG